MLRPSPYSRLGLRRVQGRAKRQVYDIEVETLPYKPLDDQIQVIDSVLQNPEIQAVRLSAPAQPSSGNLGSFPYRTLAKWLCSVHNH